MVAGIGVLPLVLSLTPGSPHAFTQHLMCDVVRPGGTAALITRHSTGNGQNWRGPWLQIGDPTAPSLISKAENPVPFPGRRVRIATEDARGAEALRAMDLRFVCGAMSLLISMVLACMAADIYIDERQAILYAMRRFGEKFIREFERPLVQRHAADHPIRSRLRFTPDRKRLEVLLAPHEGRHYPNMSDHRRNLEYDVERVLQLFADEPFLRGRPHAEGRWVVIPFQFNDGLKGGGAR